MKELKGTKTEKNLQEAFAGESQARNKYTYFASKAKKDGFVQIANIFEETAANEKEHAKLWFKYLEGGAIQDTEKNLEAAANLMPFPAALPRRSVRGQLSVSSLTSLRGYIWRSTIRVIETNG